MAIIGMARARVVGGLVTELTAAAQGIFFTFLRDLVRTIMVVLFYYIFVIL